MFTTGSAFGNVIQIDLGVPVNGSVSASQRIINYSYHVHAGEEYEFIFEPHLADARIITVGYATAASAGHENRGRVTAERTGLQYFQIAFEDPYSTTYTVTVNQTTHYGCSTHTTCGTCVQVSSCGWSKFEGCVHNSSGELDWLVFSASQCPTSSPVDCASSDAAVQIEANSLTNGFLGRDNVQACYGFATIGSGTYTVMLITDAQNIALAVYDADGYIISAGPGITGSVFGASGGSHYSIAVWKNNSNPAAFNLSVAQGLNAIFTPTPTPSPTATPTPTPTPNSTPTSAPTATPSQTPSPVPSPSPTPSSTATPLVIATPGGNARDSHNGSVLLVAGGALLAVVLVALAAILAYFLLRRRRKHL